MDAENFMGNTGLDAENFLDTMYVPNAAGAMFKASQTKQGQNQICWKSEVKPLVRLTAPPA